MNRLGKSMLEKLKALEKRFLELEEKLSSQDVLNDPELYNAAVREHRELERTVSKYREYTCLIKQLEELSKLASDEEDAEIASLAAVESEEVKNRAEKILDELRLELVPKDPESDNNVIVEIRSGAGGEEAALFVGVLYRMYSMFASSCGFRTEPINSNETGLGGFKEVTFTVVGR